MDINQKHESVSFQYYSLHVTQLLSGGINDFQL